MTNTLAQLHALASAVMETNHPGAVEAHQKAGRVHEKFAADPSRIAQDLALSREAEHLLNAVYCATEGQPGAPLTAAERLLVAAIIASRANGEGLPIPGDPDGPYRPELAEAFREGARGLLHCNLGDKIEVRAGAPVEEYTQGDGGALVQCWLLVGDDDRPTMPGEGLYQVSFTAEGIDVTAAGEEQAERYAEGDARQFRKDWNYVAEVAGPDDGDRDAAAEEANDADLEVMVTRRGTEGVESVWTFSARFELDVWATSAEEAQRLARDILRGEG